MDVITMSPTHPVRTARSLRGFVRGFVRGIDSDVERDVDRV